MDNLHAKIDILCTRIAEAMPLCSAFLPSLLLQGDLRGRKWASDEPAQYGRLGGVKNDPR